MIAAFALLASLFASPAGAAAEPPYVVVFEYERTDITPDAAAVLDSVAEAYRRDPQLHLCVVALNEPYRFSLPPGRRRFDAIAHYVGLHGVPETRCDG